MGRPRILLISANTETAPAPVYPLALAHLAGAAAEANWEAVQFDANVDGLEALPDAVSRTRADLMAVSIRNVDNNDSCRTRQYLPLHVEIVKTLRHSSDAPVVLGGSGFSIFPREIMRMTGADYGIAGAGERPLKRLLGAIERNADLPEDGLLTASPGPCEPSGGDECEFSEPVHCGRIVAHYWKTGGMIGIQSKRGCPRRCTYCTYPLIDGASVRCREPRSIAAEIARHRREWGVRYFFFVDSVFNLVPEHELAVAREISSLGLDISWGAFFSPANLDRGYLRELKRSGLTHVELGVDSLCDEVLHAYGKEFTVDDAVQAALNCQAESLHCAAYLILGGPAETPDTIRRTLSVSRRLPQTVFFPFTGIRVYPGTRAHRDMLASGAVSDEEACLEPVFRFAEGLDDSSVMAIVEDAVNGRGNWVLPSSYARLDPIVRYLRQAGHAGPLWEFLLNAPQSPRRSAGQRTAGVSGNADD